MLHTLSLHNFALVDDAQISLDDGFNVITGETGAGKSLILDALALCVGGRGGSDMIRFGTTSAELVAQFDSSDKAVAAWFDEQGRSFEGEIIIRRQISEQGRSRAWINGVAAGLSELKSLGALLVNIHSQHAGLELLKPQFIIKWLDEVGKLSPLASQVAQAYRTWQKLKACQDDQDNQQSLRFDRITLLSAKLADIEPLLTVDMTAIEQEYDELSNIEALIQAAYHGANLLDSDNDNPSVNTLLARSIKLCEQHSQLSSCFREAYDKLSDALELIKDTHATLADYADHQSLDPARLDELNQLMSLSHQLSNKYRLPISELISQAKDWQDELDKLHAMPDSDSIAQELAFAYDNYHTLAQSLHQARLDVAETLCHRLQEYTQKLSLPHARFEFAFVPAMASSTGLYEIDLRFSANLGMPMQSLHKVASGGELSRIALIMQVMSAGSSAALPLLVFDEVDVGISGGTAQVVGELLRQLSSHQQIIAITHQAQVAACATAHFLVQKEQKQDGACSHFHHLQGDERVYELARMSGGVHISDETLAHAKSLLDSIKPHA